MSEFKIKYDQVLTDIKNELRKHKYQTEEEEKSFSLAKEIIRIFLLDSSQENSTDIESYGQDVLFGFSFFLSRNMEFAYTRTYLNDKSNDYLQLKKGVSKQFKDIVDHFAQLTGILDAKKHDFRAQYNDLYVFFYNEKKSRWTVRIKYDNLENMVKPMNTSFQLFYKGELIYTREIGNTKDLQLEIVTLVEELRLMLE